MNLNDEHKSNPELVEVIYGTLDGNVYFFNLENGQETRPRINVGVPIKGSVTIDPRGYPLLYIGQGDVAGSGFGHYIFSLIDGSELFFLNGNEQIAPRRWGAFDSNPLFDTQNDRMILCGENGVVYNYLLNTSFDLDAGKISIDPIISRYWYHSGRRLGIESSPSAFGHYLFTTDNSGLISCIDLKTFEPVWVFNAGDDTDSTMVTEWDEEQQRLFLYTATQVDIRGHGGSSYIRKLDAETGTELWLNTYKCLYVDAFNGGVTSSPLLGKGDISDLVIFWVAMVTGRGGSGVLVAYDKNNGEIVWENIFPNWGWSSPVAVYTDDDTSYLVVSDSTGNMHLLRGTTGEIIHQINLGSNIEGSPALYGNMLVVGTRGQLIFGVEVV
jgi:outer membrane protein assembly factor BamB